MILRWRTTVGRPVIYVATRKWNSLCRGPACLRLVSSLWRGVVREPNLQFGEITYSRHERVALIGEGNYDAPFPSNGPTSGCHTQSLCREFYVSLTVHPGMILVYNQLDAQFFMYVYFYSLHVSGSHVPIIKRIIVSVRHLVYVTLCSWPSAPDGQLHDLLHQTVNYTDWHNQTVIYTEWYKPSVALIQ